MNFRMNKVHDMYTLRGSFAMPVGEIEKTENGAIYKDDGYEVTTTITKHPSGVCVRKDVFKNVSDKAIDLRAVLSKFRFNGGEYEVYTQYSEWTHESIGAWHTLITETGVGNADVRTNTGTAPFLAIYNTQNGRGMAFHILAEGTWQMKARKDYTSDHKKTIDVEIGINEKGFAYTLEAGKSLEMPTILYYEFKNKVDMDAYKLHRYYNDIKPARAMPLSYDTWLSNFDNVNFDELMAQLAKAKELGLEYFTIDAGWYDKPYKVWDNLGDWTEETEESMAGRMKEFADEVRKAGLKFGLWFEIERASLTSKTFKEHPEHYIVEGGYAFVNFANPDTREYIYKKLEDNIVKYGIEYIKFDYNDDLTYDPTNHSFIEFFKGYHEFLHRINREHPEVYLENCASGGLRMSLASLEGFDSFWISDNHSLYTQLEIFKNTLIRMPSRVLETWLTISSLERFTPVYGKEFGEKILASGNHDWTHLEAVQESYLKAVMFGGPIGMSCNLTKLSDNLITTLKEKFEEFKRDREFWAKSECHILCDTDTMLVLQFNDIDYNEIKIFSYAKYAIQNDITVYPALDENASYTVDGKTLTAAEIDENGITLGVDWINKITANATVLKKA